MKKFVFEIDIMKKSELQKFYNYPTFPSDSKTSSGKRFVNFDTGAQGGTPRTCFYITDNKSFYFDSFGGAPGKVLLHQLPKPIYYSIYKIQNHVEPLV